MPQSKYIYLTGIITGLLCGFLGWIAEGTTANYINQRLQMSEQAVSFWPITILYILVGGIVGLIIALIIYQATKQK